MSRGKDLIDDALGAIWCREAEMEEARDLLNVLARRGLESFRDVEHKADRYPRLAEIRDALAAFERAIGLEYPKT